MGSLSVYLDTSVVVPLFLPDSFNARAESFLRACSTDVVVSDFVAAEFASVVARRVRTRDLSEGDARKVFGQLDGWLGSNLIRAEIENYDIGVAAEMLRRLDLTLRTPDAVNLAVAQRLGAELATFDQRMADCARALGLALCAV